MGKVERSRVIEALESALRHGEGLVRVYVLPTDGGGEPALWKYASSLLCPESGIAYSGRCRRCSRSTRPWAPATPAGALAA